MNQFFDCHDVFEELRIETAGPEKLFLQGLIQAAVALYHFDNDNFGGARKLYFSATEKLTRYDSPFWGMNLGKFLGEFQDCFQVLLDAGPTYPVGAQLDEGKIPEIELEQP